MCDVWASQVVPVVKNPPANVTPVLQGLTFTVGISSPRETEKAKGQSTWEVAAF